MKVVPVPVLVALLVAGLAWSGGHGPAQQAYASGCPVDVTTGNGDSFMVVITAADSTCPSTYSSSGITHYALSTLPAKNPYTVALSSCSGSNCPPTNIKVLGWDGVGDRCGGSKPPCSSTGPWTFTIDATVQRLNPCDTAPAKVTGNGGQPVLILEAGVGGVCSTPLRSVPEFPLGITIVLGVAMLAVILVRSRMTGSGISAQPN
jgi:hypothetical protein